MWSELLGLALLVSLNPMLLGFILLVVSRPRPVQNLLAFWVGCLIVNVPAFVGSLLLLHMIPEFADFAKDVATADPVSGVKPFQLVTGVLAVVVAAVMAARRWLRPRAKLPAGGETGAKAAVLTMDAPGPIDRLRAAVRRLVDRGRDAWNDGALWVAVVLGLAYLPPPPLLLLVDTIVAASGASIGTQVLAVLMFVVAMLAVFEFVLAAYLVAPQRTQAVLRPVHDWALKHRQRVLIVLFAVVGLWLVVTGSGLVAG